MRKSKFTTTIDILFGIFIAGVIVFMVILAKETRDSKAKIEVAEIIND